MKQVLFTLAVVTLVSTAKAADTYLVNGKQTNIIEAVKTLMSDKNAEVLRCTPQEIKSGKSGLGLKKKDS